MSEAESKKEIQETFIKSRNGAIIRCAAVMVDAKRPDLAKQILDTTHIDKNKFKQIKAENT